MMSHSRILCSHVALQAVAAAFVSMFGPGLAGFLVWKADGLVWVRPVSRGATVQHRRLPHSPRDPHRPLPCCSQPRRWAPTDSAVGAFLQLLFGIHTTVDLKARCACLSYACIIPLHCAALASSIFSAHLRRAKKRLTASQALKYGTPAIFAWRLW